MSSFSGYSPFTFAFSAAVSALVAVPVAHAARRPSDAVSEVVAVFAIGAVEVFSGADTVATGSFTVDDDGDPAAKMQTYRLPWRNEFFDPKESSRPFVFGALGYFGFRQDAPVADGSPVIGGTAFVQSPSVSFGMGFDFDVTDWLTVTPRIPIGYSYVDFRFRHSGVPGNPYAGFLSDWVTHSVSISPSLEVSPHWRVDRWTLGACSRFTAIFAQEMPGLGTAPDSRDSFADGVSSNSYLLRNELFARYDSPWRLWDSPLNFRAAFARHEVFGESPGTWRRTFTKPGSTSA